jgi:hypothetical protein
MLINEIFDIPEIPDMIKLNPKPKACTVHTAMGSGLVNLELPCAGISSCPIFPVIYKSGTPFKFIKKTDYYDDT